MAVQIIMLSLTFSNAQNLYMARGVFTDRRITLFVNMVCCIQFCDTHRN